MDKISLLLYKQEIIDHAKQPRNYGVLSDPDFEMQELNPSCGDMVSLSGLIQDKKIIDIRFEGSGCTLSLAMASKLTEYVKGRLIDEIELLDEKVVKKLLGIDLGPNRLRCGLLSIEALKKGINKYKKGLK